MKKVVAVLVAAVCLVLAVFGFYCFKHRDERQIRKSLRVMGDLVSKSGGDGELVLLARLAKFTSYFTDDCRIVYGPPLPEVLDKEALRSFIVTGQRMFSRLQVKAVDVSVSLAEDRRTAQTDLTVDIEGELHGEKEIYIDAWKVLLAWRKADRNWKVSEVKSIQTLH